MPRNDALVAKISVDTAENELSEILKPLRPSWIWTCKVPRRIAQICADVGSWLIYLSTNYVFDGTVPGAIHGERLWPPHLLDSSARTRYRASRGVPKMSVNVKLICHDVPWMELMFSLIC